MMKHRTLRPHAALFIGAAFLATPAFAQDVPAPAEAPPAIEAAPAPQAAPARVIEMQPQTPVVQAIPDVPKPQTPPAAFRRSEAAAPVRQVRTVSQSRAMAAAKPAPIVVTDAPAPIAQAPAAITPPPIGESQPEAAPVAEAAPVDTVAQSAETRTTGSALPWILGGIALAIAALAAFLLLRRRDPEYVEQVRSEPLVAPVAEPVAAPRARPVAASAEPVIAAPVTAARFAGYAVDAPVAEPEVRAAQAPVVSAEDVSVQEPAQDDLAGVADAAAPVARRPWLELGMRPVRAGTDKDDAIVDIELTVGNAGDTIARDVRISTFMLAEASSDAQIESLLIEHREDHAVPPVAIEPGKGTRVDAHLAVAKGDLGRSFHPIVVAEARYTLPDGRQGRTSAAFRIGCPSEGGMRPLAATRPFLTETVEAELLGVPEHA